MKRLCIRLIRIYQKVLSPIFGRNCKYIPTCSEYTIQAIQKYGVWKGIFLGGKRILRCNPKAQGGFDFVP